MGLCSSFLFFFFFFLLFCICLVPGLAMIVQNGCKLRKSRRVLRKRRKGGRRTQETRRGKTRQDRRRYFVAEPPAPPTPSFLTWCTIAVPPFYLGAWGVVSVEEDKRHTNGEGEKERKRTRGRGGIQQEQKSAVLLLITWKESIRSDEVHVYGSTAHTRARAVHTRANGMCALTKTQTVRGVQE